MRVVDRYVIIKIRARRRGRNERVVIVIIVVVHAITLHYMVLYYYYYYSVYGRTRLANGTRFGTSRRRKPSRGQCGCTRATERRPVPRARNDCAFVVVVVPRGPPVNHSVVRRIFALPYVQCGACVLGRFHRNWWQTIRTSCVCVCVNYVVKYTQTVLTRMCVYTTTRLPETLLYVYLPRDFNANNFPRYIGPENRFA